jgi:hypothetical protein
VPAVPAPWGIPNLPLGESRDYRTIILSAGLTPFCDRPPERQEFVIQPARSFKSKSPYWLFAVPPSPNIFPRRLPLLMSGYVQLSAGIPTQSIGDVLSPGIVSLFIQGLETGLVISQLSQWLSLERREGFAITSLVIFVTTVGLSAFTPFLRDCLSHAYDPLWTFSVETAVCFVSAWRIYVSNFGQLVSKPFLLAVSPWWLHALILLLQVLPQWTESIHAMLVRKISMACCTVAFSRSQFYLSQ